MKKIAGKVGAEIEFVDEALVRWVVSERDCQGDPGARKLTCLVFTSAHAIRRVWEYPDDWRTQSGSALAELSWQR